MTPSLIVRGLVRVPGETAEPIEIRRFAEVRVSSRGPVVRVRACHSSADEVEAAFFGAVDLRLTTEQTRELAAWLDAVADLADCKMQRLREGRPT